MDKITEQLKIGDIARASTVAVGALRYYETLGLLQSERGPNGYRYYHQVIQQVRLIKKAQSLGFSFENISEIMTLRQQGDLPCDFVQSHLQTKINQLEMQIQEMIAFKSRLEEYRQYWSLR